MTVNDFNLLEIDIYDGDELVYSGMSENVPEELRKRDIQMTGNDGKKLKKTNKILKIIIAVMTILFAMTIL